jgi:hypothetical protein
LKRHRDHSLALGKKYDRSPDDVRSADYDATMELMTVDGTEELETQKSDIDIGRRALGIQKEVAPQQVFDFRLVREVYKELQETGWERALKPSK